MDDSTHSGRRFKPTILWAFLVGAGAIVLIRHLSPELSGAIFATFVAIGVIVWHGFGRCQENDLGRVADDTYYLGLLFTLVSLVSALVYLFIINPEGDFDERAQALIGNFGIGLLSTVAGILGRILLQGSAPVSRYLDEQAKTQPDDFAQESMALRRQVREATDAMRHFTRVTLGEAHQTRTHTKLVMGEFSDELRSAAQKALSKAASDWESFNEELVPIQKALNDTSRAFTALSENMRDRAGRTQEFATSAIEELRQEINEAAKASRAEAISAWREAAQQIQDHSLQMHAELEKASRATSQRAESSLSSLASKVVDSNDATVQVLNDLVEHTRHATRSLESLATGISAVLVTLRSFDAAAETAAGEVDAKVEEVRQVRDEVVETADSSLAQSVKAEETANQLSNEVSTQVSRLQALFELLEQVISRLSKAAPRPSNVDRGN